MMYAQSKGIYYVQVGLVLEGKWMYLWVPCTGLYQLRESKEHIQLCDAAEWEMFLAT